MRDICIFDQNSAAKFTIVANIWWVEPGNDKFKNQLFWNYLPIT